MPSLNELKIKIFADCAGPEVLELARLPYIKGFTTNPTLMHKAGVLNYRDFARRMLEAVPHRPISFEVLGDTYGAMYNQAHEIATWGENAVVKIPITSTSGSSMLGLVRDLLKEGIVVNITAVTSPLQIRNTAAAVREYGACYVSVFAGRIADTGVDPVPLMINALRDLSIAPRAQLIWASPREILNVFQAEDIGCHVITVTSDILNKAPLVGKNLDLYSLETVRMFYADAVASGLKV